MGDYVLVADLAGTLPDGRIIDLADGDSMVETLATLATSTAAVLGQIISDAETETDGYLQGRFDLPVTPVTARLKLAVKEIVIYRLFNRKPELWGDGASRNPWARQYDSQTEWLESVKESDMFIGSAAVPTSADVLSTADGSEDRREFAGGGLDGF